MQDVQLEDRPLQPTAAVRASVAVSELPAIFDHAFPAVMTALRAQGLRPSGEPFGYYPRTPGDRVEVEAGFPVASRIEPTGDVVASQLPAGRTVSAIHIGPYDTLADTYNGLVAWAKEHDLEPSGPMWECYLTDPRLEPDPSRWQTKVFVCVR
jgi:effector-binding domain-containing protein